MPKKKEEQANGMPEMELRMIQGTLTDAPSIYVASLSDYNDGRLHGRWIDATRGAEEIQEQVKEMLESSPLHGTIYGPSEEWAIHDYSGFNDIRLSEWESFETVATIAEAIEEHGNAMFAYLKGFDIDEIEEFRERYQGEYDSPSHFAEEFHEMVGDIDQVPETLRYFIDWERIAGEMDISGEFYFSNYDGSCFVFRTY